MASPIEENFIYNEIKNFDNKSDILEFGCGDNLFTNKIVDNLYHDVTGIDLYERKFETKFKFIRADFEYITLPTNYYDCIYCLSSFEHVGLERNGILTDTEISKKIDNILHKMKSILKENGILLITLPFGNFSKYYVSSEGLWSYSKKDNSIWGAKVYDKHDISYVFRDFILLKEEYYLRIGKNFFDENAWIKLRHDKCYIKKEITDSLVCLKFKNKP